MSEIRRLDHIDLRVPSLAEVRAFYSALLPALGFTKDVSNDTWLQFEAEDADGPNGFFGVTESQHQVANENRIAFWAPNTVEVDRLAAIARELSARHIEGPDFTEGVGYYAVFFEDPCGNRLEICHRVVACAESGTKL